MTGLVTNLYIPFLLLATVDVVPKETTCQSVKHGFHLQYLCTDVFLNTITWVSSAYMIISSDFLFAIKRGAYIFKH